MNRYSQAPRFSSLPAYGPLPLDTIGRSAAIMQDQFDKGVGEYNRFNEVMNTQRQLLNPNDVQIVDEELGEYSGVIEELAEAEDFRRLPTVMRRMTADIGKKMADPNSRLVRATRSNAALQEQLAELDKRYQDGDLSALDYQATKARYSNWASKGFTGAGDFQSRALLNKVDLDSTIMAQVHAIKEDSQLLAPGMDGNALKASLESLQGVSNVLDQFGAPLTEANMARASYGTAALNPQVAGTKTLAETLPAENIRQLGVDPTMSVDDFRALVKADTGAQISPADLVGQVDMWQSDGRGLLHKRTIETKGVTEGRIRQSVYQQLMSPENQAYLRQQAESAAILQGLEPETAEFNSTANQWVENEAERLTSRAVNEVKRMEIKVDHDVNNDPTYVRREPTNPNQHVLPGVGIMLDVAPGSFQNVGSFREHISTLDRDAATIEQSLRNTRVGTPEHANLTAQLNANRLQKQNIENEVADFTARHNVDIEQLDDFQRRRRAYYELRVTGGSRQANTLVELYYGKPLSREEKNRLVERSMSSNEYEEDWVNYASQTHPQFAAMNADIQKAFGPIQMESPSFNLRTPQDITALTNATLDYITTNLASAKRLGTGGRRGGLLEEKYLDKIDIGKSQTTGFYYDSNERRWMAQTRLFGINGADLGEGDNRHVSVATPSVNTAYAASALGLDVGILKAHETFQNMVNMAGKSNVRSQSFSIGDRDYSVVVRNGGVHLRVYDANSKRLLKDTQGTLPLDQASQFFMDYIVTGR